MASNSRDWGKERAGLNIRLNEAEHGFARTTGTVLHDYAVFNVRAKSGLTIICILLNVKFIEDFLITYNSSLMSY